MLATLVIGVALTRSAVDFDCKAASVGQVLEKLSVAIGSKLRAKPQLAQEIVFVRVHGEQPSAIKAHLATALAATWVRDGDTDVLTRTPALERQVWNEHVEYRRTLVDESLKAVRKRLAVPFDAKSLAVGLANLRPEEELRDDMEAARKQYEVQRDLFARGPMARLLDRLVMACDPNDLAAVGPYERRVFCLQPTVMQHGFDPEAYRTALNGFASEQQAWIDEAAKMTFSQSQRGSMVSDPRSQLRYGTRLPEVFLEVRRSEVTALFLVNLCAEGTEPFGFSVLSQTMFADPARSFLDAQMRPAPPSADDPVVPLGDDAREFQQRMAAAFQSRQPAAIGERMKQMMVDVDHNDPLGWGVSDALNAYGDKNKVNLIASLPDSLLSTTFFVSREQPLRIGQFMRAIVDSGNVRVADKDGWVTITPTDRFEAAIEFTPREAVVRLMKSVFASGKLDIRDYARYAFESRRFNRGGLGDWFLALYDRSVLGASDHTDWKALQLYGSLSEIEQRELESGKPFAYGAMTPPQRSIVERMVYANRLGTTQVDASGRLVGSWVNAVEPTKDFALGLPESCQVSATLQRNPVIVAYSRGSDGKALPARGIDPYTLATVEAELLGNPQQMSAYGVANLCGYAMGADKVVRLKVQVRPGVVCDASITLPDYPTDATPVTWDRLPEATVKQIADYMAQIKARKAAEPGKTIPPRHWR